MSKIEDQIREEVEQELFEVRQRSQRPDSEGFDWLIGRVVELRARLIRIKQFHQCNHSITDGKSTLEPIVKPRGVAGPILFCTSCGAKFE